MAKVSQSRTEWVKKGTVVNGKKVTQGYVAQKGKPDRKVSATVQLTGGGTRTYKKGRAVPTQTGGGQTPRQKSAPTMSAVERRQQQNKGVAAGTRRVGAGGKTMRQYNAKTGRWDVVSKSASSSGLKRKMEGVVVKKPTPPQTFSKSATRSSTTKPSQNARTPRITYPYTATFNVGKAAGTALSEFGKQGRKRLPGILEKIWYM
jgi:hypothetical protein